MLPVQNSSPLGRNSPTWLSIASYIIIMRVRMTEEICAQTSNFPWQLFMTDVILTAKAKVLHSDITAKANMCLDITAYYMVLHQLFINGMWFDVASPKISIKKRTNLIFGIQSHLVQFLSFLASVLLDIVCVCICICITYMFRQLHGDRILFLLMQYWCYSFLPQIAFSIYHNCINVIPKKLTVQTNLNFSLWW